MKRITLMFLFTVFAIGASANSGYKIAFDRWYNASEYFKGGKVNFYLNEYEIYFRIDMDKCTTAFTVNGVKRDDFVYMMLEKDNTFRERKEFIVDYLFWMLKNLPDGACTVWNDGGRESHYRRREKLIPEWDNDYRKYMIERGWYKNEAPKPVAQSNQGAVQELDPLADYVPVVEVLTKKADQGTKPAHEDKTAQKKTAKTSQSNNAKTTSSKPSSSAKSSAMSSSSGSSSSSASNKSSASSKENSGEDDDNSVAAWAIIIGGLYYMFGRDKKKETKTAEQRKKEEEKRRKEKREREAAARRREEERKRQEEERKYMEDCYYEEWLKKNQSGWRG